MSARNNGQSWIPYAGLMIAVGGIVYQSGQLTGDVRRNTERITAMEAAQKASSTDTTTLLVRTARIEAKLDLALPDNRRADQ